jgi:hypothetical protein
MRGSSILWKVGQDVRATVLLPQMRHASVLALETLKHALRVGLIATVTTLLWSRAWKTDFLLPKTYRSLSFEYEGKIGLPRERDNIPVHQQGRR